MNTDWRALEAYREYLDDCGAPKCLLLRDGYHKARKEHVCTRCKKKISPGQHYRSQFWLIDDEPWHDKVCPACLDEELAY